MSSTRIVHISDFHLRPEKDSLLWPRGIEVQTLLQNSNRGVGKIRHLDQLAKKLKKQYRGADAIIATGDFIDAPKLTGDQIEEGFDLSKLILESLAVHLEVNFDNIFVCPGNQDLTRSRIGDGKKFTHEYDNLFREKIGAQDGCRLSEFAVLHSRASRVGANEYSVLELDMTWNTQQVQIQNMQLDDKPHRLLVPGKLSDTEVDELLSAIDDNIGPSGLLVIAAHYPIAASAFAAASEEFRHKNDSVALWALRHVASGWSNLVKALSRREMDILFLHGDIHCDLEPVAIRSNVYVSSSGRLDEPGKLTTMPYHARGFRIPSSGIKNTHFNDFFFKPNEHDGTPDKPGGWTAGSDQAFNLITVRGFGSSFYDSGDLAPVQIPARSVGDQSLSDYITDFIKHLGLFDLRRVSHRSEKAASAKLFRLGNIRLGPVFNDVDIVNRSVIAIANWAEKAAFSDQCDMPLVVGIDSWGAALAVEIGYRLQIPSTSLTIRGLTLEQSISSNRKSTNHKIAAANEILFVTDITTTWATLDAAADVVSHLGNDSARIAAASVICSRIPKSFRQMTKSIIHGSIVTDLRIPVILEDWLPSLEMLPAQNFGITPPGK